MKNGGILIVYIEGDVDTFAAEIIRSVKNCNEGNRYLAEFNKNLFYLSKDFTLLLCCNNKNPQISSTASLYHQVINF